MWYEWIWAVYYIAVITSAIVHDIIKIKLLIHVFITG